MIAQENESAVAPSLRILVVDDDLAWLETLEECLRGDGHWTRGVSGMREAVEAVRDLKKANVSPELSILDFHLRDGTGLDVYCELSREVPGIGAIFVTADATPDLRAELERAGGFAVFPKPFDLADLRRAVGSFARGGARAFLPGEGVGERWSGIGAFAFSDRGKERARREGAPPGGNLRR